ncbi:hypothetical protein [Microvirga rosea]|uniref:hypothetical protein n=1 Tax=Microvirga rosea TaxID=2715425 RepID=UPI001D0BC4A0|nr:hypothetical protein [Microvirga rosea]MCB8823160.1 hypothetical protein [Microvirga rosea]
MSLRLTSREWRWLLVLGGLAICCASVTFVYFLNFGTSNQFDYLVGLAAGGALLLFTATAPICLPWALLAPGPTSIMAAKVHAALYTAFISVTLLASRPGHSSPGDTIAALIKFVLLAILAFELLMVWIATHRARRLGRLSGGPRWLFPGLASAIVGGWGGGIVLWSQQLPPRVIAAAEATAQGRPYCIDVDGRPATGAHDLTGITMVARNDGGWTWNFHALLVVGEGSEREYFNWSYRRGDFWPVSEHSRESLHLDRIVKCKSVEHFARDW